MDCCAWILRPFTAISENDGDDDDDDDEQEKMRFSFKLEEFISMLVGAFIGGIVLTAIIACCCARKSQ